MRRLRSSDCAQPPNNEIEPTRFARGSCATTLAPSVRGIAMTRAGYCSECQANVWLTEEGSCVAGHPASCLSGIYDAQEAVSPVEPTHEVQPGPKRRGMWWLLAAVLVIVLVGCGLVASAVMPRLASKGAGIADEWKTRLSKDYPGWTPVGFNVRSFKGADGSETTYHFTLVPPDAEFSVPVVYVATDGAPPVSQDEILRPAGRFHDRSDSLLDYINVSYYAKGKSTVAVSSDANGNVTVEWIRVKKFGPFSSRYGSFDELTYDEATREWTGAQP